MYKRQASDCVEERAFDEGNKNDFAASSLRAYLNGEFLRRLIKAGAPEEMFEYFNIDLTADDGLKNYGGDRVRIPPAKHSESNRPRPVSSRMFSIFVMFHSP